MSGLLPYLAVLAGFFLSRWVRSQQSERGRVLGYALGGLGLIVLGTVEAPDVRSLQLFGLGMVLYGTWRGWRRIPAGTLS